jgi:uncharacterized protein (TIGR02145 family)
VVAINAAGNSVPSALSAAVTPRTVPGAPTSPVATAGNAQASVAFTAPVSNGGSAITGYRVTSSPGSKTATGTSSPIVVTGLTNGTAYTFTVVAINAVGNSVPSAASTAVTPTNPSSGGTAVVSSWKSTIGCSIGAGTDYSPVGVRKGGVNRTMVQGVAAPTTATVTLVANVTSVGSYTISTNTLNGVTFSKSGTFSSTGAQTVTLTPSGTPIAAGNFNWVTNRTPSIDVYGSVITTTAPLGSTYTAHRNGIGTNGRSVDHTLATYTTGETFSNNLDCDDKLISAQGCNAVASVTVNGRSHPTVLINGQCWLKTNLIAIPSVYSNYTLSSWSSTEPVNQGYWGYYNKTNETGSSGWQSTEPGTNEGLLYQWCGAMNATISERSQGICPAGFHIPSDCEWKYLEHGLGMSIANQNETGYNRADAFDYEGTPGYKLRSQGTGATNASGFSGILTGYREPEGNFRTRTIDTSYWTSTIVNGNVYYRDLYTGKRYVERVALSTSNDSYAVSVRCLKD